MIKATKLAMILVAAGLTVGCASKSDITSLQTQIDGLKAEVSSVKGTAEEAQATAMKASSDAKEALGLSRRTAADVDAKLNAGFKHKMMK
jgi:hypothetical protein